jgi:hypothetical protein
MHAGNGNAGRKLNRMADGWVGETLLSTVWLMIRR